MIDSFFLVDTVAINSPFPLLEPHISHLPGFKTQVLVPLSGGVLEHAVV
jgi:hypothetical protein